MFSKRIYREHPKQNSNNSIYIRVKWNMHALVRTFIWPVYSVFQDQIMKNYNMGYPYHCIHVFLPHRSCVKDRGLKIQAVGHMIVLHQ